MFYAQEEEADSEKSIFWTVINQVFLGYLNQVLGIFFKKIVVYFSQKILRRSTKYI